MILACVKRLLNSDITGRQLCQFPSLAFEDSRMGCVLTLVDDLLTSIIIDLNHEVNQGALSDYNTVSISD
jgi:hypothetical protein